MFVALIVVELNIAASSSLKLRAYYMLGDKECKIKPDNLNPSISIFELKRSNNK